MEKDYSGVYGIDLGTTNSVICRVTDNEEIELVPNLDGGALTPSFIWVKSIEGEEWDYVVGIKAKEQMKKNPERVLSSYKPRLAEKGDYGVIKTIDGVPIRAEKCSEMNLEYLRNSILDKFPNDPIKRVVITVPAYFESGQKAATRKAANRVFNKPGSRTKTIIDILPEPSSTILSYDYKYGIDNDYYTPESVLVYDLGGGTFDISLIVLSMIELWEDRLIKDVNYTVVKESGDRNLGGDDIDKSLSQYVHEIIKKYKDFDDNLYKQNIEIFIRQIELAKISICDQLSEGADIETVKTDIDCSCLGIKRPYSLSGIRFAEAIKPVINQTIGILNILLAGINSDGSDIDRLLLVGGSTKIPLIKDMIEEEIPNLKGKIFGGVNPDYSIAEGAATRAKMIVDNRAENLKTTAPRNITVKVTPKTLNGEDTEVIIRRDSALPIEGVSPQLIRDESINSDIIQFEIYEGDSPFTRDNNLVGTTTVYVGQGSVEEMLEKYGKGCFYYGGLEETTINRILFSISATMHPDGILTAKLMDNMDNISGVPIEIKRDTDIDFDGGTASKPSLEW